MKTTIIAQPLTKAAFAPYGSVIEPYDDEEKCPENSWDINRGFACRHDSISKVQNDGGEVGFSIFRTKRRDCPITLSVMEYHPFGTQAFFSMNSTDYIVVVAKAGEPPKSADDLEVFYARSYQGVQYDANVWHHPLLALKADCDFLVVITAMNSKLMIGKFASMSLLRKLSQIEQRKMLFRSYINNILIVL